MKLNHKKIKRELKRLGWTQEEFAKKMGKNHRQQVSYYLNQDRLSMSIINDMARVLDLDPKDLLI